MTGAGRAAAAAGASALLAPAATGFLSSGFLSNMLKLPDPRRLRARKIRGVKGVQFMLAQWRVDEGSRTGRRDVILLHRSARRSARTAHRPPLPLPCRLPRW